MEELVEVVSPLPEPLPAPLLPEPLPEPPVASALVPVPDATAATGVVMTTVELPE